MLKRFNQLRFLLGARGVRLLAAALDRDDVAGRAAEVSFYAVFALFPFLYFVSAVAGSFISEPSAALGQLFILMHRFMPVGTAALFARFLEGPVRESRPYLFSLNVLVFLWAGSQGFEALLKALAVVNRTRDRKNWAHRRALAIAHVIPAACLSLLVLVVMSGPYLATFLPGKVAVPPPVAVAWNALRWPCLVLLVATALTQLCSPSPYTQRRLLWPTAGSLVTAVGWSAASAAMSLYVDRTAAYSHAYGSIGDLMVLLLWVHLGSVGILLGAEIDMLLRDEPKWAVA